MSRARWKNFDDFKYSFAFILIYSSFVILDGMLSEECGNIWIQM